MKSEIFFDISSELFFQVNVEERKFEYVDKNVSNLLGFSAEDLMSKEFLNFVHPEDRQKTLEFLTGKTPTVFPYINRYVTKDGNYVVIRWLNAKLS